MSYSVRDLAIALVASGLSVVLVRQREIVVFFKNEHQRSPKEQREMERGLLRGVVLELLLFAPASVMLMWMAIRPLLLKISPFLVLLDTSPVSFYSLLGVLSYGFPFVTLRVIVTRIVLNTLKEFATIAHGEQGTSS